MSDAGSYADDFEDEYESDFEAASDAIRNPRQKGVGYRRREEQKQCMQSDISRAIPGYELFVLLSKYTSDAPFSALLSRRRVRTNFST